VVVAVVALVVVVVAAVAVTVVVVVLVVLVVMVVVRVACLLITADYKLIKRKENKPNTQKQTIKIMQYVSFQ
jgi:hypothetical protein